MFHTRKGLDAWQMCSLFCLSAESVQKIAKLTLTKNGMQHLCEKNTKIG